MSDPPLSTKGGPTPVSGGRSRPVCQCRRLASRRSSRDRISRSRCCHDCRPTAACMFEAQIETWMVRCGSCTMRFGSGSPARFRNELAFRRVGSDLTLHGRCRDACRRCAPPARRCVLRRSRTASYGPRFSPSAVADLSTWLAPAVISSRESTRTSRASRPSGTKSTDESNRTITNSMMGSVSSPSRRLARARPTPGGVASALTGSSIEP